MAGAMSVSGPKTDVSITDPPRSPEPVSFGLKDNFDGARSPITLPIAVHGKASRTCSQPTNTGLPCSSFFAFTSSRFRFCSQNSRSCASAGSPDDRFFMGAFILPRSWRCSTI